MEKIGIALASAGAASFVTWRLCASREQQPGVKKTSTDGSSDLAGATLAKYEKEIDNVTQRFTEERAMFSAELDDVKKELIAAETKCAMITKTMEELKMTNKNLLQQLAQCEQTEVQRIEKAREAAVARGRRKDVVRVVVLGDAGVGKTTLITSLLNTEAEPKGNSNNILPEVLVQFPIGSVQIIDTSAESNSEETREAIASADGVLVLYSATNKDASLASVCSTWIPAVQRNNPKAPVVLVCTQIDRAREYKKFGFAQDATMILERFSEVTAVANTPPNTVEPFASIQRAIAFPSNKFWDDEAKAVSLPLLQAVNRIFNRFDGDEDGALNDAELTNLQQCCFGGADVALEMKEFLLARDPGSISDNGVTCAGLILLVRLLVENHKPEMVWAMLTSCNEDGPFAE